MAKRIKKKAKVQESVVEVPKEETKEQEPIAEEPKQENPKTTPPYPIESSEMTNKEMNDLLVELVNTNYWQAIKRFNAIQCVIAENSLCSLDPFKEPTLMAQNQGIRMGILKLESVVTQEVDRRKKIEEIGGVPKIQYGGQGYGYT